MGRSQLKSSPSWPVADVLSSDLVFLHLDKTAQHAPQGMVRPTSLCVHRSQSNRAGQGCQQRQNGSGGAKSGSTPAASNHRRVPRIRPSRSDPMHPPESHGCRRGPRSRLSQTRKVALQDVRDEKDYDVRELPLAEARLERLQKEVVPSRPRQFPPCWCSNRAISNQHRKVRRVVERGEGGDTHMCRAHSNVDHGGRVAVRSIKLFPRQTRGCV